MEGAANADAAGHRPWLWGHKIRKSTYTTYPPFFAGMNVCVDTGRLDEAQRILDVMRAAGLSPGWASYHILMKYHARRGDMDAARRLFVQLRSYLGGRVPGGLPRQQDLERQTLCPGLGS